MIISPGIIENLLTGSLKSNSDSSVVLPENCDGSFGTLIQEAPVVVAETSSVEATTPPVVENTENSKQVKTLLNNLQGLVKLESNNPKTILAALLKLSAEITANPAGQTSQIKSIDDLEKVLSSLPIGDAVVDNSETQKMLTDLVHSVEAIFSHAIGMAEAMNSQKAGELKTMLTTISKELKEQVDKVINAEGKEIKVDLSKIKVILQQPVVETKPPVDTQAKQQPVVETKPPVDTQAKQQPVVETKPPVDTQAKQQPVVAIEQPVDTQAKQQPVVETEPPVDTQAKQQPVVETEPPVDTQAKQQPVVETEPPVDTQAKQQPVVETEPPVETQAKQQPVVETEQPVDTQAKQQPVEPQPKQEPVVESKQPVDPQAKEEPVISIKQPVDPQAKLEVDVKQPAKIEKIEPEKVDLSDNKEVKKALETLVTKIIDKIQTQNIDTKETKIDIKPVDADKNQTTALELENIMEQLQVLVQPATQQTTNVEVKILPALQQTQVTQNEINVVLNKLRAVLSQQLNGSQGTPMDVKKVSDQIKTDLDGVLNTISNVIDNKEIQITIPKLIKQITEAIGTQTIDTPQPKKSTTTEVQKPVIDAQAGLREQEKTMVNQSRKDPLSQLDRALNVSNIIVGESKPSKTASQLLGRLTPPNDMIIERTLPEKIKDIRPLQDQTIDLTSKNAINSLFTKNNDPALAGVRFNNIPGIISSTLTSVASTMNAGKPNSIVNQVMDAVRNNFNKNQITVSLKPYNLGNVDVNVSLQKGALIAHVVTETNKAAESLKNGITSLRQALGEAGLNVDKIVVMAADKAGVANNNLNNNDNQQTNKDHNLNNQAQDQQQHGASKGANLSQDRKSENAGGMKSLVGGNNSNNTSTENTTDTANQAEGNYINTEKGLVNYRV